MSLPVYKSTYYQVLGVQPGVSTAEIKRAYRRLVKSYHPDIEYVEMTESERTKANQRMIRLNEAYETLKDKSTRAAYDSEIGVNGRGAQAAGKYGLAGSEQNREQYLQQIFHPMRQKITRVLAKYKKQLIDLSQDIYDQHLVDDLENYANEIESVLRQASQAMAKNQPPPSVSVAELMMKYAIAHAVDGLEELRYYCGNYDYNHLTMAGNLFRESNNLSRQALHLTKL